MCMHVYICRYVPHVIEFISQMNPETESALVHQDNAAAYAYLKAAAKDQGAT